MRRFGLFFVVTILAVCGQSANQTSALPDPRLTPGDTVEVTATEVCTVGYTKKTRRVPVSVKRQVYSEYGRELKEGVCCKVDHLIPLELGGSNRIANLWREPLDTEWNADAKDRLERRLHRLVCMGQLDLSTAQKAIARDWIAAYREYVVTQSAKHPTRHRQ